MYSGMRRRHRTGYCCPLCQFSTDVNRTMYTHLLACVRPQTAFYDANRQRILRAVRRDTRNSLDDALRRRIARAERGPVPDDDPFRRNDHRYFDPADRTHRYMDERSGDRRYGRPRPRPRHRSRAEMQRHEFLELSMQDDPDIRGRRAHEMLNPDGFPDVPITHLSFVQSTKPLIVNGQCNSNTFAADNLPDFNLHETVLRRQTEDKITCPDMPVLQKDNYDGKRAQKYMFGYRQILVKL